MHIYLVGGAVRDEYLNLPICERDWVVVGATPQQLLDLGYRQVGRDFPVFLHPKTKEEYALARQERKVGEGYLGFVCDYDPSITLEEDLLRRDLTINAMARSVEGVLIDPCGGLQDIQQKKLRHVSRAFVEDPLRILRVARFQARLHHLGFTIAEETLILMRAMVRAGELQSLTPERVWAEWEKSLATQNPEKFIEVLRQVGALPIILPEFHRLFGVPQSLKYHPEIDAGIHTLQVTHYLAQQHTSTQEVFAGMTHDLGKGLTSKDQWPSQAEHDVKGVDAIRHLCQRLKIPNKYRDLAQMMAEVHIQIHQVDALDPEAILDVLMKVGVFRQHPVLDEILRLCQADACASGLTNVYAPAQRWQAYARVCQNISPQQWVDQGLDGKKIQQLLRQARLKAIQCAF
jgi:tRNA nucleotidyltransferase (CCA-adding enzyme)